MQPKVWIVNSSGHDFRAAESFGKEMIPLTEGKINVFNVQRLIREFKQQMKNFNENDWLLLSGSAIINIVAVMVAIAKHGEVKLLIYDVIRKEYVPRELSLRELN